MLLLYDLEDIVVIGLFKEVIGVSLLTSVAVFDISSRLLRRGRSSLLIRMAPDFSFSLRDLLSGIISSTV